MIEILPRDLRSRTSVSAFSLAALLAYMPYAQVLNEFVPLQILGYSVFVTMVPSAVLALIAAGALWRRPKRGAVLFVIIAATLVILLFRWSFDFLGVGFWSSLVGVRYTLQIPIMLIAVRSAGLSHRFVKWAPVIIVANGVLAGLVGILYSLSIINYHVSPTFGVTDPVEVAMYLAGDHTRASGLFAGANGYGNFLVLPLLILGIKSRIPKWLRLAAAPCMVGGIVASQSRTAVIMSLLVLVWVVFRIDVTRLQRVLLISLTAALLLGGWLEAWSSISSLAVRIQGVTSAGDIRAAKNQIFISALERNASTFLVGAHDRDLSLGNASDLQASDNGYLLMASSLGIPLAILFLGLLLWQMKLRCPCGHASSLDDAQNSGSRNARYQ